jgi:hypothetical protein
MSMIYIADPDWTKARAVLVGRHAPSYPRQRAAGLQALQTMPSSHAGRGLARAYWLHLLAAVVWLGGLAVLVDRAARDARGRGARLAGLHRPLTALGLLSLTVLIATGLMQLVGRSRRTTRAC